MATNNVINANSTTPLIVTDGGTGANSLTIHGLLKGDAAGSVSALPAATNGQLPIGSTSSDPVLNTITAGAGITVTNGAGTITISSAGAAGAVEQLTGDSGIAALPLAGSIDIAGGNNIATVGSANTITVNVAGTTVHAVQVGSATNSLSSIAVGTTGQVLIGATAGSPAFGALGLNSGLTAHGLLLGQGTSAITALGVATNGQLPIGSTGADPVLATITAGTGITVTNGAGTITIAASGGSGITTLDGDTGSATGSTVTIAGSSNITTSATSATLTVTLDNNVSISGNYTSTAGNLNLPATNSALTTGVINIGGAPFIYFPGSGGSQNIFMGSSAGNGTLSGIGNIGIGDNALESVTTGTDNVAFGSAALFHLTTGQSNTAIGNDAGNGTSPFLRTGSFNTFIGADAGGNYTGAESSNILIGNAGVASEGNVIRIGTQGSGSGEQNACFIAGTVTAGTGFTATTGDVVITAGNLDLPVTNTALTNGVINSGGSPIMQFYGLDGNGYPNIFIGALSGNGTLSAGGGATDNVGIGSKTLLSLTSGGGNIGISNLSLTAVTSGQLNLGFGYQCGFSLTTGSHNSLFGQQSLLFCTTGSYNTILGAYQTAINYTGAESSNIIIQNTGVTGESNTMRIGTTGTGNAQVSTTYIAGITGVSVTGSPVIVATNGQLGVTVSSRRYKENISDMDEASSAILNLRPVTFTYKNDLTRQKQYGLIAEEVDDVMPSIVTYNLAQDPETVRYHDLPVLLLNELQKQNNVIAELQHRIAILERRRGYESKA